MKALAVAGVLLMCASGVHAKGAFDDGKDAIEYRQAAFSLIKENFADMAAMLKKKKPMDKQAFAQRAEHLALLAPIPFNGFKVAGSDKGDTDALAAIWTDGDEFNAIAEKFQQATKELAKVSQQDDMKAIGKAFGAVGKNCKGCHDQFKAE
ncbi:c-type cytochrome [Ferrimonas lipolytica]|uniref:Cytochrome c n=1 Tax=Ferrimonas lipolytica TaxID=2724191 RepID=A0A6H1U934_9GAMM|nr:cytochrome c [Ferrimonas lipolytica]QIZ75551.1 cytochrome c [Ferrimonas lipolytica]